MRAGGPARVVLTVVMDALVVIAVALAATVVVRFFGVLADSAAGVGVARCGAYLTVPFGVAEMATPYAGIFDADAAITMTCALLGEWALAILRRRVP